MNPPFGGKEGKEAQTNFAYKTSATQVLFLQHVIDALKPGGRCGMVIDEGVLFRTTESAFVQTKRKLLDELRPVVHRLAAAGRLLVRGRRSEDEPALIHLRRPDRARLVLRPLGRQGHQEAPTDAGSIRPSSSRCCRPGPIRPRSWTVTRAEIEARGYDLKAVNPTAKAPGDTRTPLELLDEVEARGHEVDAAVARLRALLQAEGES